MLTPSRYAVLWAYFWGRLHTHKQIEHYTVFSPPSPKPFPNLRAPHGEAHKLVLICCQNMKLHLRASGRTMTNKQHKDTSRNSFSVVYDQSLTFRSSLLQFPANEKWRFGTNADQKYSPGDEGWWEPPLACMRKSDRPSRMQGPSPWRLSADSPFGVREKAIGGDMVPVHIISRVLTLETDL